MTNCVLLFGACSGRSLKAWVRNEGSEMKLGAFLPLPVVVAFAIRWFGAYGTIRMVPITGVPDHHYLRSEKEYFLHRITVIVPVEGRPCLICTQYGVVPLVAWARKNVPPILQTRQPAGSTAFPTDNTAGQPHPWDLVSAGGKSAPP